jgi:hypothetical protein
MGYFLAVSAFRDVEPQRMVEQIIDWARSSRVGARVVKAGLLGIGRPPAFDDKVDTCVFSPVNGWTVVLWPDYFNIHDVPACQQLSRSLHSVVSTIHVYDSDYWAHTLLRDGEVLDRFASVPGYFVEDLQNLAGMAEAWKGNPEVIGSTLGVAANTIAPYLVHLTRDGSVMGKVREGDEFEIGSFWVFVDFWRRVGIQYPADLERYELRVRFDKEFAKRLPTIGDGEL